MSAWNHLMLALGKAVATFPLQPVDKCDVDWGDSLPATLLSSATTRRP
jgi:hypothetical protein